MLDRYVAECDAGHSVLVAAINACVDISTLHTGEWGSIDKLQTAKELLWRAAHSQRAAALLKLLGVLGKLETALSQLDSLPEELRALVQDDFRMRKAMVDDICSGRNRSHASLVLYQDVWRLSPHLTDPTFQRLRVAPK